jgi:hypothetical protein
MVIYVRIYYYTTYYLIHFAESSPKSYKNGREMAATEIVRICARSMERDGIPVKFHVSCIFMRSARIVETSSVEHFSSFVRLKSRAVHFLCNNVEYFGSGGNNTVLHSEGFLFETRREHQPS